MLTFALLAGRRMKMSDLPAYCETVPVFREFNARFLRLGSVALAELLVAELEKTGAMRREGEFLVAR